MTNKDNKWIKFYPSLELPKERVSIAYDTHDERKIRYAYGYFQFHNGNCSSFWKDGNEQPKVVKAEDIKYWMPVPFLDVKEEPVNNDFEMALAEMIYKAQTSVVEPLVIATQWKDELIKLAKSEEPASEDLEKEVYEHLWKGRMGTDVSKPIYFSYDELLEVARHFANWQKELFEKNRLKHCKSITNEQVELEQGFIDQHLDKYQRMPTFLDAIEYGMRLQNEQMMAKVSMSCVLEWYDGFVLNFTEEQLNDVVTKNNINIGDKVKVIVIKED